MNSFDYLSLSVVFNTVYYKSDYCSSGTSVIHTMAQSWSHCLLVYLFCVTSFSRL